MNFIKNLFLTNRFFYVMAALVITTMLSYAFPFLFAIAKTGCVLFIVLCFIDAILLFNKSVRVSVTREIPSVLSLGDNNAIQITLVNKATLMLRVEVIDELPEQFQQRNFKLSLVLYPDKPFNKTYELRPTTR